MIRVLIVEDSPTVSLLLKSILESDAEIEVIGVAANGAQGVKMALALKPDLITMDIRMPVMDGFEATRRIMQQCATPIVVVSCSVEASDLMITFNAIRAGALDVIEKPRGMSYRNASDIRLRLINTVKLMAQVKVIHRYRSTSRSSALPLPDSLGRRPLKQTPSILAVAASTGGPTALNSLFRGLPADFPLPIVAVQHMTAGFILGLVAWLQQESRLPIRLAVDGEQLTSGTIYLAPEDWHLMVGEHHILRLSQEPPVNFVRPSATMLFRSVAGRYGAAAIGVLLTGMGEDGAAGLKALYDVGAPTIVQDESTSVVYGMPKAAADLGAAGQILPIEEVAPAILALLKPR